MPDWGLYTALRGQDNWAQRRADKMVNMKIAEQNKLEQDARVKQSMLAEEEVNKYLDTLNSIDVLPEDQDRIKQVEKKSRQSIIQGIAKNNGDLARYVSSGGITDLHEYKNSILQSKEVKNALTSKENLANIIAGKQRGDWFPDVEVDVPKIKDGKPELDADGNQIYEKRKVSNDKQLAMFKDGIIDKINFNGSEKKVSLNAIDFHRTPKDPKNPFSKNNIVTYGDVMFQAMEKGASERQAHALAKNYVNRVKAGADSWKWGNKSEEERQLYEAKFAASRGGSGTNSGNNYIPNYYNAALYGEGRPSQATVGVYKEWKTKNNKGEISRGAKYRNHNITLQEKQVLSEAIGIDLSNVNLNNIYDKDNDYIPVNEVRNKNKVNGDVIVSPRSGDSYSLSRGGYTVVDIGKQVHSVDGKQYFQAQIYVDEDTLDDAGIRNESYIDKTVGDWKGLVTRKYGLFQTNSGYMMTAIYSFK